MMFAKNQRSNGPKTKKLWKFKVSNFEIEFFSKFDLPDDFSPYGHV